MSREPILGFDWLFFGLGCVLLDLGRPDRALNVLLHGNFTSPLLWDVASISTYLTGSTIYLYLPLIPDIAILRDHLGKRRRFYRLLALGWRGSAISGWCCARCCR